MLLTNASRNKPNSDSFPTVQLLILGTSHGLLPADQPLLISPIAICRVAEPIALASCFPYAWVMVKDFNVGGRSNSSFWAGIFISSFALAESLTGLAWGGVSDRIGRKPVLLIGCAGTLISLLIVGFSTNFWVALAGRALGGLLSEYEWYCKTCYSPLTSGQMETLESFKRWSASWSRSPSMNVSSIFCIDSQIIFADTLLQHERLQ